MLGRTLILRLLALLSLAGLVLAACFSDATPSRDLVGLWESTYRGRGGEANSLVILSDSLVDRYFLKAIDFRFSTFGDSLRLQPILPDSFLPAGDTAAPVVVMRFALTGDTLIRTEAHRTEWFVREGPPPAAPLSIMGVWKAVRSTDAFTMHSYHRYLPDSVLEVRLPVAVKHGVYQWQDDSLWFTFADGESSRCSLTVRGDSLDLTRTFTNGTFSYAYVRASVASWYTLEEY